LKLSVGNKILMLGLAILVVLNIANFLFLGEFFEHEEDPVLIKKDRGEFWFDFWEEWLEDEGILNDGFLDYLARGRLEISRAEDEKEIQEILHSFTIVIKERINSQMENKQIINLKNSLAENLEFHSREGCFILLPNGNSMEVFEIKGDFSLKPDFHEKIKGFSFTRPVQISWEDENLTVDQQEFLKDFLEKKEKELEIKEDEWEKLARKAGYADLKGEGVIVKVFDLRGGYRNEDIVHDTDIRRIVNELFAAGAEGVGQLQGRDHQGAHFGREKPQGRHGAVRKPYHREFLLHMSRRVSYL